jgi:hypothetical protein
MIILAFLNVSCKRHSSVKFKETLKFEISKGKETATYEEMMLFYKKASAFSEKVKMKALGNTDAGLPLHLITFTNDEPKDSDLNLLINNGIHPGESDGIDASMLLLRDLINGDIKLPDGMVLHIIPAYNLGGMKNRNKTSRANQNGPEAYGFRGNARNYDLNRDFIKMDTKNMETFAEIFHSINPDVYVETHVSNGADYQYTLTHLMTQHNKLGHDLGRFTNNTFTPALEKDIRSKNLLITPYVNVHGRTPDKGFSQFFDAPRYSTGYTALFNTLGLMIETHMLKPYKKRVLSTKAMLESIISVSGQNKNEIKSLRTNNFEDFEKDSFYKFNFKIDSTQYSKLDFKGYESSYIKSDITSKPRLKYFNEKPKTIAVDYYNHFKATDSIKIPDLYIISSAWSNIINRLKLNDVKMKAIENDTAFEVDVYKIKDYKTYSSAYEDHYPHYNTKTESYKEIVSFNKGDLLISTRQPSIRFIIETLEPELSDSFFNWNFFDSILQQKEGFSAYVFEDYAEKFLNENPDIKKAFLQKKESDTTFSNSAYLQLDYIYKKSPLYENAHLRYPVFRVFD